MPTSGQWTPAVLQECRELHTLYLDEPVQASDGLVTTYFDGIGMLICNEPGHRCHNVWPDWFRDRLWTNQAWPIGMGQSGAVILGMLGKGTLIRSPYKTHGLAFQGALPKWPAKVALVDDISVTGKSFDQMEAWCKEHGLDVVDQICCVDLRPRAQGGPEAQ